MMIKVLKVGKMKFMFKKKQKPPPETQIQTEISQAELYASIFSPLLNTVVFCVSQRQ